MERVERDENNNDDNQIIGTYVEDDINVNDDFEIRRSQLRIMLNQVERELELTPKPDENEKSLVFWCFTSRGCLRIGLIIYWFWTLTSIVTNADLVFPGFFLVPVCALLLGLIGSALNSYQLLIPLMLMNSFDMLYVMGEFFFLISLHLNGSDDISYKFLKKHWPKKAEQMENYVEQYYLSYFYLLLKFIFSICLSLFLGQEITRYRVSAELKEKRDDLIRRRDWIRDQQYALFVDRICRTNVQQNSNHIFESLFPPLPSYDTLTAFQTPQQGTPPPYYTDVVSTSPKMSEISTAMSPSSYIHH